jgi:hypothetical protein
MRSLVLAAILALVVTSVPAGPALAGGKKPSPPHYTPPHAQFPSYRGVPVHVGNYRNNRPGVRLAQVNIDVTFSYNGDVGKVRTIDPPEGFDDKGNVKKYTKEELKQFKGDTAEEKKMAGYKSDFSELKVGDLVQVLLSVHKNTAAKKTTAAASKAGANPDADAPAADAPPEVSPGKWVVATQLVGRVTKINSQNTAAAATMTVRVTTTQAVSTRGRVNTHRKQTVGPTQAQATVILIGRRQTRS